MRTQAHFQKSNNIRSINPAGIVAPNGARYGVSGSLGGSENRGKTGSRSSAGTGSRSVKFCEKNVIRVRGCRAPLRPQRLVHGCGDHGILEDDPTNGFEFRENLDTGYERTWQNL